LVGVIFYLSIAKVLGILELAGLEKLNLFKKIKKYLK
jgi:hypothetical protein